MEWRRITLKTKRSLKLTTCLSCHCWSLCNLLPVRKLNIVSFQKKDNSHVSLSASHSILQIWSSGRKSIILIRGRIAKNETIHAKKHAWIQLWMEANAKCISGSMWLCTYLMHIAVRYVLVKPYISFYRKILPICHSPNWWQWACFCDGSTEGDTDVNSSTNYITTNIETRLHTSKT